MTNLMCGNCGNKEFKLSSDATRKETRKVLHAKCTKCNAVTDVVITEPELKFNWAKDNEDGILCDDYD